MNTFLLQVGLLLGCLNLLCTVQPVHAQEVQADQPVVVTLSDGTNVAGVIEWETDTEIQVRTATGVVMTIPREQIASIRVDDGASQQQTGLRADPNQTRPFFAPTARSLGHGTGYLAVYEIFFPFVAVGIGDALALSGGISLLPGTRNQLLYASPKITMLERENIALAAGAFAATFTGEDGMGGVVYGTGTFGPPRASLSTGVGFAFGGGEFAETPIFMIGGDYQLSDNVKLLSENYLIPEAEGFLIVSGGIRFMGERLSADFGLFTSPEVLDEDEFFFFPWLGFAYAFGK